MAIASDIELHRFVAALLSIIPKTLPLLLSRMHPIFVVGDETEFALAWPRVNVIGDGYLFVLVYISHIHPIDLVQTPKTALQFPYHEEFFKLPDNAYVILTFEKLEGHEVMPRHSSEQATSSDSASTLDLQLQLRIRDRRLLPCAPPHERKNGCSH
jgi:hypothetical protein